MTALVYTKLQTCTVYVLVDVRSYCMRIIDVWYTSIYENINNFINPCHIGGAEDYCNQVFCLSVCSQNFWTSNSIGTSMELIIYRLEIIQGSK